MKNIIITSVICTDQGVFLKNKKQEVVSIPFSELDKTYIQKRKFSIFQKIVFLAVFLLIFISSLKIISIELASILIILYIPLLVTIQKYKWYQMYVLDKAHTKYCAVFFSKRKEQLLKNVAALQKGIFDNRHDVIIQNFANYKPISTDVLEGYAPYSLRIA